MKLRPRWVTDAKECWEIDFGQPWPGNIPNEYEMRESYSGPVYTKMLSSLPRHPANELYANIARIDHQNDWCKWHSYEYI